ncbi:MAG: helix-turn-helix domain-containing protein, partial [Microthrixaceae bacterium]
MAGDDVGDHVVEVTIDLIAQHGLAGFSMDELARRAKVSKASIYKRWRSRAELLHDVSRTGMAVPIEDPDTG